MAIAVDPDERGGLLGQRWWLGREVDRLRLGADAVGLPGGCVQCRWRGHHKGMVRRQCCSVICGVFVVFFVLWVEQM